MSVWVYDMTMMNLIFKKNITLYRFVNKTYSFHHCHHNKWSDEKVTGKYKSVSLISFCN